MTDMVEETTLLGPTKNFIPVNTCVAADFRVDVAEINQAKNLLAEKYASKFNIPSHITILLMPYTQTLFERVKPELERFFSSLSPIIITIKSLDCETDRKFFSLKVDEAGLLKVHRELLSIAGKYRSNELREKDIKRLEEGRYEQIEKDNLVKHGFVFTDNLFNSHLTLGSCPGEADLEKVKGELSEILNHLIGTKIILNHVNFVFHTDSPNQSDMVELYKKEFLLS
mgnify:CR=1 FL=1